MKNKLILLLAAGAALLPGATPGQADPAPTTQMPITATTGTAAWAGYARQSGTAGFAVQSGTAAWAGYAATSGSAAQSGTVGDVSFRFDPNPAFLSPNGNDTTGALGDPFRPFLTGSAAQLALPWNGEIVAASGTYGALTFTKRLKVLGAGSPIYDKANRRLTGGTIFQGGISTGTFGCILSHLGADTGDAWMLATGTAYGRPPAIFVNGGTNNSMEDVVCLTSTAPSLSAHCIDVEVSTGLYENNVWAYGGIHANVLKGLNQANVSNVFSFGGQQDNFIIKTNGPCSGINLSNFYGGSINFPGEGGGLLIQTLGAPMWGVHASNGHFEATSGGVALATDTNSLDGVSVNGVSGNAITGNAINTNSATALGSPAVFSNCQFSNGTASSGFDFSAGVIVANSSVRNQAGFGFLTFGGGTLINCSGSGNSPDLDNFDTSGTNPVNIVGFFHGSTSGGVAYISGPSMQYGVTGSLFTYQTATGLGVGTSTPNAWGGHTYDAGTVIQVASDPSSLRDATFEANGRYPCVRWTKSSAGTDAKNWLIYANDSSQLELDALSDTGAVLATGLTMGRNGSINFPNALQVGMNGTALALIKMGTATLASGTAAVSDSDATGAYTVVPSNLTFTGTPGVPYVTGTGAGSFSIGDTNAGATNVVKYLIFK